MQSRREAVSRAHELLGEGQGLLGPSAVHRVVGQLLPFIDELRDTGASWEQIARLLFEAGFRSRGGEAVIADSLRATVSRVRRQAAADVPKATAQNMQPRSLIADPGPHPDQSAVVRLSSANQKDLTPTREGESHTLTTDGRADDLRARIKRAAAIRGSIRDGD